MRRLAMSSAITVLGLIAAACGGGDLGAATTAVGIGDGSVPSCAAVPEVQGAADSYRDTPVYVANEMPVDEIRAWAGQKPGFEEIWIDRDNLGWITVAFSVEAETRQAELEAEFPDVGVVAVGVDWTMAGLEDLQARVSEELGSLFNHSSWISVTQGVVGIGVGVLKEDRVVAVNERFAGERVCIEGTDPAEAPVEGPQPAAGEGWRLLADEKGFGQPYRTGIATDESAYERLWIEIGLTGERPAVNFSSEVVIWFGAVFGSSCPDLRLDRVTFDHEQGMVYADIVLVDQPPGCTADANPFAYVVAVDRSMLPVGPFAIQLTSEGPPPGAPEERTLVNVDLTQPGSVANSDQVGPDPALPEPFVVESGSIIEPGFEMPYRLHVHCGIEWLGQLNYLYWRTEIPPDILDYIPLEWKDAAAGELFIEVTVVLQTNPEPTVSATLNGHTVIYKPTGDTPGGCD